MKASLMKASALSAASVVRTAILSIALLAIPSLASAQRGTRDTTIETSTPPLVDISAASGKVVIRSISGNTVNVQGLGRDQLIRVLDAAIMVAGNNANSLTDRRQRSREAPDRSQGLLELDVPRGSRIVLKTMSADLLAESFWGDVDFTSASGDLQLVNSQGNVIARTLSGDISIAGQPSSVQVTTASGDITVHGVTSKAEVHSISGDIVINGRALSSLIAETVNGDVSFNGNFAENASVKITTHSGDISLDLSGQLRAQLEWISVLGDLTSSATLVRNDGGTDGSRSKGGRKRFQVDGGGPLRIVITTFSGDTHIRKKE